MILGEMYERIAMKKYIPLEKIHSIKKTSFKEKFKGNNLIR